MTPVKVWTFNDAPEEYKALSRHGGDEDWVALIPSEWNGVIPFWAEEGSRFGCCSVSEHPQPDGALVIIGAHA